jgi:hypothetical protein
MKPARLESEPRPVWLGLLDPQRRREAAAEPALTKAANVTQPGPPDWLPRVDECHDALRFGDET